jgi:hypothetical protein
LLQRLQKTAKERPREAWVSAESQIALMERFRESNARVAQKWFAKSDGVLFPNSSAEQIEKTDTDKERNKEALIDMLIDTLIATVKTPANKRGGWRYRIGK